MADMSSGTRRARRGAIGAVVAAACVGCCSLPFVAGTSIGGVALCSTRFLGIVFGVFVALALTAVLVGYRIRKRRQPPGPVAVEFGPRRERVEEPS